MEKEKLTTNQPSIKEILNIVLRKKEYNLR